MKLAYLLVLVMVPNSVESSDVPKPIMGQLRDDFNQVFISWTIDGVNITITITAKSQGWVGLGFSASGAMTGADLVIGWIDNGIGQHQDFHGVGNQKPEKDKHNDYELLNSMKNATLTTLTYRRRLITCDPEDYPITRNTIKVIYAWNNKIPENEDTIEYHQENRFVRGALLFNSIEMEGKKELPPNTIIWNMTTGSILIPVKVTTYMCTIKKLPEKYRNERHYYIGRAPIIPEDMLTHVHHRQIQVCNGPDSQFEDRVDKPVDCTNLDSNMECLAFVTDWAVGGGPYMVPDNVQVPIGKKFGGSDYYLIQTHYTNEKLESGLVDTSYFQVYLTKEERPDKGGSLAWLPLPELKMILPPQLPAFNVSSIIPSECTKAKFPPGGINIFNVFLHTHKKGRKIFLRHFRGGVELEPIASDNNYDFDYQQSHEINPPRKVLPGDCLVAHCVYNTMKVDNAVLAGLGTPDEMCFIFLQHYPIADFSMVLDGFDPADLIPYFDNPEKKPLKELIASYDFSKFTEQQHKDFQDLAFYGRKSGVCLDLNADSFKTYNDTKFPDIKVPYVEKDVCKKC